MYTSGAVCIPQKMDMRAKIEFSVLLNGLFAVPCRILRPRLLALLLLSNLLFAGCIGPRSHLRVPRTPADAVYTVETTGYCACSECCSWERNWFGRPTYSSGPLAGKKKRVGETASGRIARPGTIAADTAYFPMGTIIYIPGYGYGRVEDRGGAIKGARLDLYFKRHREALVWGRVQKPIHVWYPK